MKTILMYLTYFLCNIMSIGIWYILYDKLSFGSVSMSNIIELPILIFINICAIIILSIALPQLNNKNIITRCGIAALFCFLAPFCIRLIFPDIFE